MNTIIHIIRCPVCKRLRECEYVGATSSGRGHWRCLSCGVDFELSPALTLSFLDKEITHV